VAYDPEHFRKTKQRLDKATASMMRSDLPPKLKVFAWHILSFLKSKCDHEWGWAVRSELSKRSGCSSRTVTKYLKALRELGLFTIEQHSPKRISEMLQREYDYQLPKMKSARYFSGFKVNWDHPLWNGATLSDGETQTIHSILQKDVGKIRSPRSKYGSQTSRSIWKSDFS
jgi:hypothetical protein